MQLLTELPRNFHFCVINVKLLGRAPAVNQIASTKSDKVNIILIASNLCHFAH